MNCDLALRSIRPATSGFFLLQNLRFFVLASLILCFVKFVAVLANCKNCINVVVAVLHSAITLTHLKSVMV